MAGLRHFYWCLCVWPFAAGAQTAPAEPFADVVAAYEEGDAERARRLIERDLTECARRQLPEDECAALMFIGSAAAGRFGDWSAAVNLAERMIEILERTSPEPSAEVALAAGQLGDSFSGQGAHAEAEAAYRRAYANATEALGLEHDLTLVVAGSLVLNLEAQQKHAEAEPLLRHVIDAMRARLDPNHPDLADGYEKLAVTLHAQRRFDEAEPLFQQAFDIRSVALGADHELTIRARENLAGAMESRDGFAAAEPHRREVLRLRLERFGEAHPDTAAALHGLAVNLAGQNRHAEAEALLRRELAALAALGAERSVIAEINSYIAQSLTAQGRHREAEPVYRSVVDGLIEVLGEDHHDVASALAAHANNLHWIGRYEESRARYEHVLRILSNAHGSPHPVVADIQNSLGDVLLELGRYDEAESRIRAAYEQHLQLFGEQDPATSKSEFSMGQLLYEKGDYREAERWSRSALETRRAVYGDSADETLSSESQLASVMFFLGRHDEAEQMMKEALDRALAVGNSEYAADLYNSLGFVLRELGRLQEAESLLRSAVQLRRSLVGEAHPFLATTFSNLAVLLEQMGRVAEAEDLHRKSLEITLSVYDASHSLVARAYNNLASNLFYQRRYEEAEGLYRLAYGIYAQTLGERHRESLGTSGNLGMALMGQGRLREAETELRRNLEISSEVFENQHPALGLSSNNLASVLDWVGRLRADAALLSEAERLYRDALHIMEQQYGEDHPRTAAAYHNLAVNLGAQRRWNEAEASYRRAADISRRVLGEKHESVATTLAEWASMLAELDGRSLEALTRAREASAALGGWRNDPSTEGNPADARVSTGAFVALLKAVRARLAEFDGGADSARPDQPYSDRAALLDEGFRAAQVLTAGAAGAAVAQMAARFAARDDALAALVREHQDVTQSVTAVDKAIVAAWSEQQPARAAELRARASELGRRLEELNAWLREAFPDYAGLVSPEPLSIAEVQSLLEPTERVVVIAPSVDETFIYGVGAEHVVARRLDAGFVALDQRVTRLRCDVDPASCATAMRQRSAAGSETEPDAASDAATDSGLRAGASAFGGAVAQGYRPFDRQTAYELYRDLLGPLEEVIGDAEHLYIVTSGALSGLPFSVLVTEPPAAGEDDADPEVLRNTAWLGARYALTTLPSVSSLKALRQFGQGRERQRFVGFGDPVLGGATAEASERSITEASNRGLEQYFRGVTEQGTALADPESIRASLAPLPGTRAEMLAMAEALGASPETAVKLGESATEGEVKRTNLATEVLAFATHGLIAGELRGLGEPGLVLTPPAEATAEDDGILTASEAAQLALDVEWLILSACNTASADGTPGAEGLSGLARAFMYAGARALLVSHWRVRDDVTARLTVEAIRRSEGGNKAEALREAMTVIRTGRDESGNAVEGWDPSWAHPSAWAPFVLVGGAS